MTRRLMVAGSLMVALALLATVSAWAQQTPRIRAGGEGEIQAPKLTKRVSPVYPDEAKEERIQGSVVLETVIDTEGKVIQTVVKKSVPALDDAAETAVRQWQYVPTLLNNQSVEVVVNVTISFVLN